MSETDGRVVVHIGSTKTGSSALQATLFERRASLADVGAHYSERGVASGAHHLLAAAIHTGAWRLHRGELPDDRATYFRETAAAVRSDARAEGAHTIVLSSEYWWGSFPFSTYETLRDAFAPARFEVVAFVRRPEEWAVSSYLQAVKSGEERDFSTWFERTLRRPASGLNYFRVINRWVYLLGGEAHVLRYEDVKDNVFAAFCRAAKLDVDTAMPPSRVNPSPTRAGLEALLAVNRSDRPAPQKAAERQRIMRDHRAEGPLVTLLTPQELADLRRMVEPSDGLIARRFLGRPPPLFEADPAPNPPEAAMPSAT